MAVPAFLNSSHYYGTLSAITDVQDIIDELGTILLVTNDPVWTEPVGDTFKSPVDALGRWFSVAVSRIDADTLQLVVADQYGTTIATKRIDIDAAGTDIRIYSGQYHLWIESCRPTFECFRSGILDLSPQDQDAWNTPVYAQAYRNNVGTATNNTMSYLSMSGTADSNNFICAVISRDGTLTVRADPAGNNVFWPVFIRNGSDQLVGRMYQVLFGTSGIAYGTSVNVPVDSGVVAAFKCVGVPSGDHLTEYRFLVRAD